MDKARNSSLYGEGKCILPNVTYIHTHIPYTHTHIHHAYTTFILPANKSFIPQCQYMYIGSINSDFLLFVTHCSLVFIGMVRSGKVRTIRISIEHDETHDFVNTPFIFTYTSDGFQGAPKTPNIWTDNSLCERLNRSAILAVSSSQGVLFYSDF